MTEALYLETSKEEIEVMVSQGRRLNVSGVLKYLGVSRSGYYAWKNRLPSVSKHRKEAIKDEIIQIYNESKQIYGAPKIAFSLQQNGENIAVKTVGNYMREMGIHAQWIKPYTTTTTDPSFSSKLKNILNEQFNPDEPNAVWCSDITYIWTYTGFVYLTSIMDLFSRRIVAWKLSTTLEAKWAVEAVNQAKKARKITKPLVIHSDRGIQYVSSEYLAATRNMINSYSKKAYPWDNACIESFHSLIKREWLNRFKILDYNQAYQLVFEYIETFYNTIRIHSHCNYLSPLQFELEYKKTKHELQTEAS